MNKFRVEFYGGNLNGAIRYYDSLKTAKSVASRYYRVFDGLGCSRYCDISIVSEQGFSKHILSYG